jgi:2C-methyl-D-erythritol 2,4-cyclodiphosphate synthase
MAQHQFLIGNEVTVTGIAAAERELCNRHAKRDVARRAISQVRDGVMSAVLGGEEGKTVIEIVRVI